MRTASFVGALGAAIVLVTACGLRAGESSEAEFYVAAGGSDAGPGTRDKPLATIAKAQAAVRAMVASGLQKDVRVLVRGGNYELAAPLAFGPEDSGTQNHSITYASCPGEKAVLSGGRHITGWKREGRLWTAEIPEVKAGKWSFRQLFVNGQRATRARDPNPGQWLRVKSVSPDFRTIAFQQALGELNLAGQDAELVMLQNWSISRAVIVSSDAGQVVTATPVGWIGHGSATCASPRKPAYLEHARQFLDQPREWYLDRAAGLLSYLPAEGEDAGELDFVAPQLEHLIIVAGVKGRPVRNLRFVGLGLEHTEFPLPEFGYSEIQAAHYGPAMKKPTHVQPVAVELTYAEDCRVERCRMAHLGASAIGLGVGCRRNTIIGCELTDVGGTGVMVGWRGKGQLKKGQEGSLDADWEDPADAPSANEVSHNWIHRCGAVSHGAVGVFAAFSADTKIAHNEVHDLPYTGISVGYRWNTTPTTQCRAIVEHNHIYDVMKLLADGGGIYSLGLQPGTVMRGNVIHDVHRSSVAHGGAPNNGFFIDEGSKDFLFESNVVDSTSGSPVRFNQCRKEWHTWKDNLFNAPASPEMEKLKAQAGPQPPYRRPLQ